MVKTLLVLVPPLVVAAGCASGPSHIPPAWQLPGAAISTAMENATYAQRRSAVKAHVDHSLEDLKHEAATGKGGTSIAQGMRLAGVKGTKQGALIAVLKDDYQSLFVDPARDDAVERVTVVFMVHGR